jgi:hypothetical protein
LSDLRVDEKIAIRDVTTCTNITWIGTSTWRWANSTYLTEQYVFTKKFNTSGECLNLRVAFFQLIQTYFVAVITSFRGGYNKKAN